MCDHHQFNLRWILWIFSCQLLLRVYSFNQSTGITDSGSSLAVSVTTAMPQGSLEAAVLSNSIEFSARQDLLNLLPAKNGSSGEAPMNFGDGSATAQRIRRQERYSHPSYPNDVMYPSSEPIGAATSISTNVHLSCPFPHPNSGRTIHEKLLAGIPVSANTDGDTGDEQRTLRPDYRNPTRSTYHYQKHQQNSYTTSGYEMREDHGYVTESTKDSTLERAGDGLDGQNSLGINSNPDESFDNAPDVRNIVAEIEILRFTNEQRLLADGQPCQGSLDGECTYRFSGVIKIAEKSSPASLISAKQGKGTVDINARTKRVACATSTRNQKGILQVAVTSSSAMSETPVHRLKRRQIRISWNTRSRNRYQSGDDQQPFNGPGAGFSRSSEDNNHQYLAAPDQYSRDRYDDFNHPFSQSGGGLVNIFDCPINIAEGNQQWETLHCTPRHPDLQMGLMFRYIVYNLDDQECAQQSHEESETIQWTPLGPGK